MFIQLRNRVSEEIVKTRLGTSAKATDAKIAITGDATVYKPNGKRLMTLRRGALSEENIQAAWPFMYGLRVHLSDNRGVYAGGERMLQYAGGDPIHATRSKFQRIKGDGTLSRTNRTMPLRSAVIGFLDRGPRQYFCRQTRISTLYPNEWGQAMPFIQEVAALFKDTVPDRYATQLAAAKATHPSYVLTGTPFTTVTVNNTVAGAYHTDKGDFEPGFGVMVVFRKGEYRGADFVFPAYGVSCDLQHGDVIFFDPHEVHGNIPFHDCVGKEGEDWIRISMVLYFREHMPECLAPDKELERARHVRGNLQASDR